ncbi:beta-propeller fold lactonase family protein [Amycolatopsis sp. Poz14]|uniref:beta-propeller fold lactonase family protein n=1 Tax=Amycolatopsis sp. Poz14 TaxID=1447705 RepID=UPI001EE7BB6C|nr:beta-propeller fold lactonase family protein [Amycolatopsis sp. Poz14]MCG3753938.1 beta-propeller fold lactonase family protein [Amycolatopsis sp. Poz14]
MSGSGRSFRRGTRITLIACLATLGIPAPALADESSAQPADRAYVVAQSGGVATIDLFSDGSVQRNAPLFPTGSGTFGITASPDRRHLYVAPGTGLGTASDPTQKPQLVTIRVGSAGQLQPVGQPLDLAAGLTPVSAAFSHDGRDLYLGVGNIVAGFVNGAVLHFRIGDDGTPVQQGGPVALGLPLDGAAEPIVSPDGKSLYVASYLASSIVRFAIQPDGSLSGKPVDRVTGVSTPITPAVSPDGRFLYIADEQSQSITAFRIRPDDSLEPVPGSPFPTGAIPHNFVFSSDGKHLYSANTAGASPAGLLTGDGSVSAFDVRDDGSLAPLPGSPYRTLAGPIMVNRSTDGRWLYVTSSRQLVGDKKVMFSSYPIRPDGTVDTSAAHSVETGQQTADGPEAVVLPATS